ncbi:MAG: riboflavin synthase [Candidatus Yanofskybacteria bacterium]|nr:riboflavin synthase [Candidatus Yanofskybacteria bacterium]
MFSGIVQSLGVIREAKDHEQGKKILAEPRLAHHWKEGASVSISGICSTVVAVRDSLLECFYMPETLQKTTAGQWQEGTLVNIEPSLKVGDEISGHFVFGHVDGRVEVESVQDQGASKLVGFYVAPALGRFLAPKGSVTLDGVSLTVVETKKEWFTVSLIPYTLEHTTVGGLKVGTPLNIEIDMLARYIAKLL